MLDLLSETTASRHATDRFATATQAPWVGKPTVVFDGHCNFCIGWVKTIRQLDRKRILAYTPFQKAPVLMRLAELSESELRNKMHLITPAGSTFHANEAIAEILHNLGVPRFLTSLLINPVAASLYKFIANNRYRIFGCSDKCYIPQLGMETYDY